MVSVTGINDNPTGGPSPCRIHTNSKHQDPGLPPVSYQRSSHVASIKAPGKVDHGGLIGVASGSIIASATVVRLSTPAYKLTSASSSQPSARRGAPTRLTLITLPSATVGGEVVTETSRNL